ncbi:MAG: TetR/AcrR family transcriptional regulator C-terminal domain-containing protein [Oscillospiraceae bacterium]|nr:TetR/AcrR family transcriptional regulator C-terminal domain-containing protein [Oscillospiraceae bacterium]
MLKLDTKQIFADAIVELAKTKPLDKITVQNIVDHCGAGRQTFYNHFKDKEDLIAYVYISDENKCLEQLKADYSLKERVKLIFDTFIKKKQFYISAYSSSGQNALADVIFEHYFDFYTNIIEDKFGKESIDEKLKEAICFCCYGSIGYVRYWMKEGMRIPSEKMAEIMTDNIPERLKKYL